MKLKPLCIWFAAIVALLMLGGFGAYTAVNAIAVDATYGVTSGRPAPAMAGVRDVTIETADGETLLAWRMDAQPGQPTFLFFDGNGHTPRNDDPRIAALAARGAGLLMASYRGYAGSTGRPSERGFREDARAAYAALIADGVAPSDIVIHGYSLGSAVAVQLAAEREARALVLEAPMTAILDVAKETAPQAAIPLQIFLRDRFLSRDYIGRVRMPVMIAHGTADRSIPFVMGEQMFALANEPKTFHRYEGGTHDDLVARGLYDDIFTFLGAAR